MNGKIQKIALSTLASLAVYGSVAFAEGPAAKNLILFIADGFSVSNLVQAPQNLRSLIDKGNVALLKSDALDQASAITAIATGRATSSGRVSIAPDNTLTGYDSIVTRVIPEKGTKAAGVVTSGNITDPEIAAFYGHSKDAQAVDFIASQAAVSGYDVFLGSGSEAFRTKTQGGLRDDDDDIWSGLSETYTVINDAKDMAAISDPKTKLFGAFKKKDAPTLVDMTTKAIGLLSDTASGFALVVNDNDDNASSWEALDAAVGAAMKYASIAPDTLILVTGTVGINKTPIPVIAGGSSTAATWFRGFMPNTSMFTLMADAVGASKN